ncbi:uncharacterized protein LOC142228809 [Haematobia irritans]|uniref:Putative beta-glucosidase btge n=1 Tax=Haematobia irritans TaxID=7368 RepID=A0A1L8EJ50_HAEIR
MIFQKSFIIFTIACVAMVSGGQNILVPERSILNFLASTSQTLQDNPSRTLECFNYYIPLIDEAAQEYQYELGNCTTAFQMSQQAAIDATAEQRDQLAKTVNDSCAILTQCENAATADSIFQCYINQGPTEAKTLYTVSTNATSQYALLQEQIRQAQTIEQLCESKAKVEYEKESTQAYAELNSCILNDTPIPTTAAPSPTVTEGSSTEDVPSTTVDTSEPTGSPTTLSTPIDIKPEEDIFKGSPRLIKF